MKRRDILAASINAGITIVLLPVAHVSLSSGLAFADLFWRDLLVSGPLALLVFWRTLVHARRFRRERAVGPQSLVEAATVGFFFPIPFVYPALLSTPSVYLILVAGAAVGLAFGVLLRSVAMLTWWCLTRRCSRRAAPGRGRESSPTSPKRESRTR